jgi:hypothetical protein
VCEVGHVILVGPGSIVTGVVAATLLLRCFLLLRRRAHGSGSG